MRIFKPTATVLTASMLIVGISAVFSNAQPVERTSASQNNQPAQQCPADTEKGAYFSRGTNKDGNITCGFTYFNACPYFEGAEAGTPECEKGKPTPEQLEPWNPEETAPEPTSTTKPAPTNNSCGK